ncbi:MAG TPA: hypothetical protein VFM93_09765 [Candidatus Limnocylindria bacterium]|nr:hypothetical protein [Candidatus Limnocylindria bacterium]
MTRTLRAFVLALALLPLQTITATAQDGAFVYRPFSLPALENMRTYIVSGARVGAGCAYTYPTLELRPGRTAIAARLLAYDAKGCRELLEEGVPTAAALDTGTHLSTLTQSISTAPRIAGGKLAMPLATSVASGYHRVWWYDIIGLTVNYDQTNISWSYDGSCALNGSASGNWGWDSGNWWRLISNGGTTSLGCSRYIGDTWSHMQNSQFEGCFGAVVDTYYDLVRASGWYDGLLTGDRSTYTTYGGCLLRLWYNYTVVRTG